MAVKFEIKPARLKFRYPFRIAHGVRTGTDVVLVRAECSGYSGFGEATLPPYLGLSAAEVVEFLESDWLKGLPDSFEPAEVFAFLDQNVPGLMPAKAAVDMALWDLKSRLEGKKLPDLLGFQPAQKIPHSYTLGVSDRKEMQEKVVYGLEKGFRFFKLKLNGEDDRRVINDFRSISNNEFAVDVNQAWKSMEEAKEILTILESEGCVLIEQPFDKSDRDMSEKLRTETNIPVIADEACQRISDMDSIQHAFDGLNIKLQKCGGITEAMRMIEKARKQNLKILIGCMSESSIGCNMANNLSPLCDWADLDGPFLISNDDEIRQMIGYDGPMMKN